MTARTPHRRGSHSDDSRPRRRRSGLSWRRPLGTVLALACLILPAACTSSAESADGPVTLRLSTWGNDARLKRTQQAVDAFTVAHPDIAVSIENTEFGSYWDKLATSTAANDSPDVIQMDEAYIAAYGSRAALLDLGTVDQDLDLSGMDADVLAAGKVDDVQVGAPVGVTNLSIAVNPSVLDQAGIAMPDDTTWTWDDLAEISAQVTQKLGGEGIYGLDTFGSGAAELVAWSRQRGEVLWPGESDTAITQQTISGYFDYANKLVAMKATPSAALQVENASASLDASLFATNKAAFHPIWHTQVSAFGAASGQQITLLRLPAQAPGESAKMANKASMYWSVSARTQHQEAAAKLIDFLLTDPAAAKALTTERGIPAIPAVQEQVAPLLDPQARVALDFTRTVAPELVPPPRVTPATASGFAG